MAQRVHHLATSLLKSSNNKSMSAWYASYIVATWSSVILSTARDSRCCAWKRFSDLRSSVIKWSRNGSYKEIRQSWFGVSVGWLALVVCLPHRQGILSDISKDLAKLSADWYNYPKPIRPVVQLLEFQSWSWIPWRLQEGRSRYLWGMLTDKQCYIK